MSANAATWFYQEPEHHPYLISERLNGTFWQARIVGVYWRCMKSDPPFRAVGYAGDKLLELEWQPGQWVALKIPQGYDAGELVQNISTRILAMPATLTYGDVEGRKVTEWHADGGSHRWSEIQGSAGFRHPERISRK